MKKKYAEVRSIDLHGYNLVDANKVVEKFITTAFEENIKKIDCCDWQRIAFK